MARCEIFHFCATRDPLSLIDRVHTETKACLPEILSHVWPVLISQTAHYPVSTVTGDKNSCFALDRLMLTQLLNRRFLYWPNYNLIALLGAQDDLGTKVCNLFPTTLLFSDAEKANPVSFSNYDHIPIFEQLRNSITKNSGIRPGDQMTDVSILVRDVLQIDKYFASEPCSEMRQVTTAFVRNKHDEQLLNAAYSKIFDQHQKSKT